MHSQLFPAGLVVVSRGAFFAKHPALVAVGVSIICMFSGLQDLRLGVRSMAAYCHIAGLFAATMILVYAALSGVWFDFVVILATISIELFFVKRWWRSNHKA